MVRTTFARDLAIEAAAAANALLTSKVTGDGCALWS